jgi:hypothetical protein
MSTAFIIIIIIISGVRLSPHDTAATTGPLYQLHLIDDGDCGAIGGMKIGRGNLSTRRKSAAAPLCTPQIPHDQTSARSRPAVVRSQWRTALSYDAALRNALHIHISEERIQHYKNELQEVRHY